MRQVSPESWTLATLDNFRMRVTLITTGCEDVITLGCVDVITLNLITHHTARDGALGRFDSVWGSGTQD
jgi:hypothetical protein